MSDNPIKKDVSDMTHEEYLEFQKYVAQQYGFDINKKGELHVKPQNQQKFSFFATDDPNKVYSIEPDDFVFAVIQQSASLHREYLSSPDKPKFITTEMAKYFKTLDTSTTPEQLKCMLYPVLYYILKRTTKEGTNNAEIIDIYLTHVLQLNARYKVFQQLLDILGDKYVMFTKFVPNSQTRIVLVLSTVLVLMWDQQIQEKDVHKYIQLFKEDKEADVNKKILELPRKVYNINNIVLGLFFLRVIASDIKYATVLADKMYDTMDEIKNHCSLPTGNKQKLQSLELVDKYLGKVDAINKLVRDINVDTTGKYIVQTDLTDDSFNKFVEIARRRFSIHQFLELKDPSTKNYQHHLSKISKLQKSDGNVMVLDPSSPDHIVVLRAFGFIKYNRDNLFQNLAIGNVTDNDKTVARLIDRLWDELYILGYIHIPHPFTSEQYLKLTGPKYTLDELAQKMDNIKTSDLDLKDLIDRLRKHKIPYDDTKSPPEIIAQGVKKLVELKTSIKQKCESGSPLTKEIQSDIDNFNKILRYLLQIGVPLPRRIIESDVTCRKLDPRYNEIVKKFNTIHNQLKRADAAMKLQGIKNCDKIKIDLLTFKIETLDTREFNALRMYDKEKLYKAWRGYIGLAKNICGDVFHPQQYIPEQNQTSREKQHQPPQPPKPPQPKQDKWFKGIPFPLSEDITDQGVSIIKNIILVNTLCNKHQDKELLYPELNRILKAKGDPKVFIQLRDQFQDLSGVPDETKEHPMLQQFVKQANECLTGCSGYYLQLQEAKREAEQARVLKAKAAEALKLQRAQQAEQARIQKAEQAQQRAQQQRQLKIKSSWDKVIKKLDDDINKLINNPGKCDEMRRILAKFRNTYINTDADSLLDPNVTSIDELPEQLRRSYIISYNAIAKKVHNQVCLHESPVSKLHVVLSNLVNNINSELDPTKASTPISRCKKIQRLLNEYRWKYIDNDQRFQKEIDVHMDMVSDENKQELHEIYANIANRANDVCNTVGILLYNPVGFDEHTENEYITKNYIKEFNNIKEWFKTDGELLMRNKKQKTACNTLEKYLIKLKRSIDPPDGQGFLQQFEDNDLRKQEIESEWMNILKIANSDRWCKDKFDLNQWEAGGILIREEGDDDADHEGENEQHDELEDLLTFDVLSDYFVDQPLLQEAFLNYPGTVRDRLVSHVIAEKYLGKSQNIQRNYSNRISQFIDNNRDELYSHIRRKIINTVSIQNPSDNNIQKIKKLFNDDKNNEKTVMNANYIFQTKIRAAGFRNVANIAMPNNIDAISGDDTDVAFDIFETLLDEIGNDNQVDNEKTLFLGKLFDVDVELLMRKDPKHSRMNRPLNIQNEPDRDDDDDNDEQNPQPLNIAPESQQPSNVPLLENKKNQEDNGGDQSNDLIEDRQAQAEADAQAKAQAKAQAEAQQEMLRIQAKAKADADAQEEAQQEMLRIQAKAQADANAQAEAEQEMLRIQAEAQADADAEAQAQQEMLRIKSQQEAQADADAQEQEMLRIKSQQDAQAEAQIEAQQEMLRIKSQEDAQAEAEQEMLRIQAEAQEDAQAEAQAYPDDSDEIEYLQGLMGDDSSDDEPQDGLQFIGDMPDRYQQDILAIQGHPRNRVQTDRSAFQG